MSYNLAHFTQEKLAVLVKEIDLIIRLQDDTLEMMIEVLLATNEHVQPNYHEVFINLLAKIRLNLGSCVQIMPTLKTDYRFKVSTNLLYRAIIDDLINMYYLLGFVVNNDQEQYSLNNELSILHKEFLVSCETIIKSEAGFKHYLRETFKSDDEEVPKAETQKAIADLRNANPEVYHIQEKRWKTGSEIRSSSHSLFENRYPPDRGFISESQKINFIKSSGFQRHDALTYLFKYLSQHQHFSPKMHTAMLADNDYDVICYQVTLMELTCCLAILVKILKVNDKDWLNQQIHTLIEGILTKEANHGS
jgi:hypothetical protein